MTLRVIFAGLLFMNSAHAAVLGLTCVRDYRETEGPKYEITLKKNTNQTYQVSFSTTARKTWGAPETTETKVLMAEARCDYDTNELVGDCFESHTKNEQKYLNFTSRVSRYYNKSTGKVEQSPLMLDFRFDDLSSRDGERMEYKYFMRKDCVLDQG